MRAGVQHRCLRTGCQMARHMCRHVRAFGCDQRGTVSVELLLWLPLLSFWITASIVWYDAYMSRNQAAKVAHTISDIVSRQEEMSGSFLMQIDALQRGLLNRASGEAALRISTIRREGQGYDVVWSCVNDPASAVLTNAGVPTAKMPRMGDQDTVVLTELAVPWTRFSNFPGLGEQDWTLRVVTRPRFTPQMALSDACG